MLIMKRKASFLVRGLAACALGFASLVCVHVHAQTSFLYDEDIAVFYPARFDSTQTLPSFAIVKDLVKTADLPDDWAIKPEFTTTGEGKTLVKIAFNDDTDLYGTGLVTGTLRRNGYDIPLWNNDNFGYYKPGLYQSHPWIMGVRPDGKTFGIIADNSWRSNIRLSNPMEITSEGPAFRVIVIEKDNPAEMLQALVDLTGHMNLPPIWAIGYHQSRYNPAYRPEDILRVSNEMRRRKHPCDVMWFDLDYMDGKRVFTFDLVNYFKPGVMAGPVEMNDTLHKMNFKAGYLTDPGVKIDEAYDLWVEGNEKGLWVLDSTKQAAYQGEVWPGMCNFPDFTMPETRAWWGQHYGEFITENDIDAAWNDMNEPGVFNTPEWTMHANSWHKGGGGLAEGPHTRYHNVYGSYMTQATYEGITAAVPDKRPFILSRANHLGAQRYCATWTGDNVDTWEQLKLSIPQIITLGMSGQPFVGPDLGGYGRNGNAELMGHWLALAPYYPFSRNHTSERAQEPWSFGEQIENVSRNAVNRRYQLLPYLYTLFREAAETGMPMMRPVFFTDFADESLREEEQAFMLGGDLLVVPRWAIDPVLPKGDWDELTLEAEDDGYQAMVAVRGGAILPYLGHTIQSTAEYTADSLTLYVNPAADWTAEGTMYDDAGEGFGYKTGDYAMLHFACAEQGADSLKVTIEQTEGAFTRPARYYRVAVTGGEAIQYSDWTDATEIVVTKVDDKTDAPDIDKLGVYFLAGTFSNWFDNMPEREVPMLTPSTDDPGLLQSEMLHLEAGDHRMKITNAPDWNHTHWGGTQVNNGLTGTAIEGVSTTQGLTDINFKIAKTGNYYVTFRPATLEYAVVPAPYQSVEAAMYARGTFNNWVPGGEELQLVADNTWEVRQVYIMEGDYEMKFANTYNWTGKDWGGVEGLEGTAELTSGGGSNLKFTITTAGLYTITFNDLTLAYSIRLESDPGTGVAETPALRSGIYPNPATDVLHAYSADGEALVEIYSTGGTCFLRERMAQPSATFDISSLPAGTYLVRMCGEGGTDTHKLLKQ